MREKRMELAGMEGLQTEKQKLKFVLETATDYAKEFDRFLEGRTEEVSSDELQGGAKIGEIFTKTFVKAIEAKELDILYVEFECVVSTNRMNHISRRTHTQVRYFRKRDRNDDS